MIYIQIKTRFCQTRLFSIELWCFVCIIKQSNETKEYVKKRQNAGLYLMKGFEQTQQIKLFVRIGCLFGHGWCSGSTSARRSVLPGSTNYERYIKAVYSTFPHHFYFLLIILIWDIFLFFLSNYRPSNIF